MRSGQNPAKPGHPIETVLEVKEQYKAIAEKELEVEDPTKEEGEAAIQGAEIKDTKVPKRGRSPKND